MRQRQQPYRSRKWLEAVHKIECCVLCGAYGVQAAHINEGKGMSQKTDDCLCAAICQSCHHDIDNGNQYTRDQRRELLRKAAKGCARHYRATGSHGADRRHGMTDGTGKPCPICQAPMVNLSSINRRECVGCQHKEPWHLSEGQKPLINTSRGDRKQ